MSGSAFLTKKSNARADAIALKESDLTHGAEWLSAVAEPHSATCRRWGRAWSDAISATAGAISSASSRTQPSREAARRWAKVAELLGELDQTFAVARQWQEAGVKKLPEHPTLGFSVARAATPLLFAWALCDRPCTRLPGDLQSRTHSSIWVSTGPARFAPCEVGWTCDSFEYARELLLAVVTRPHEVAALIAKELVSEEAAGAVGWLPLFRDVLLPPDDHLHAAERWVRGWHLTDALAAEVVSCRVLVRGIAGWDGASPAADAVRAALEARLAELNGDEPTHSVTAARSHAGGGTVPREPAPNAVEHPPLRSPQRQVLRALAGAPVATWLTVKDVANECGRTPNAPRGHLKQLEALKLVEQRGTVQPFEYRITVAGRAVDRSGTY